jgi:hypothetical protein
MTKSSNLWRRRLWLKFTNITEELCVLNFFYPEGEGNKFLRNNSPTAEWQPDKSPQISNIL